MIPREVAKTFLDEIFTHAAARLVMLCGFPIFSAFLYLSVNWIDNRFDKVDAKQTTLEQKVTDVNATLATNTANDQLTHDRLIIAEQTMAAARDDRDRFQKQVIDQLTQMQKDINRSAIDISAISAYISAQGSRNPDFGTKVPTRPNGARDQLR